MNGFNLSKEVFVFVFLSWDLAKPQNMEGKKTARNAQGVSQENLS